MDSLRWTKAKSLDDDEVARAIRKDIRVHRREKGRAGHRFRFATLKNLWYTDQVDAVLNHTDDPLWQHWHNDPDRGWLLIHWYPTRREAQAAAELPHPESRQSTVAEPPALDKPYLVEAGWPVDEGEVTYSHATACSSERIASDIARVWQSVGRVTRITPVGEALPDEETSSNPLPASVNT